MLGIILVLGAAVFSYWDSPTGGAVSRTRIYPDTSDTDSQGPQYVSIGFQKGGNSPNTIIVQGGREVVLRNDGTIRGCAGYIIQRQLGINADLINNEEYRFTPLRPGAYKFSCSMGMFVGNIVVE